MLDLREEREEGKRVMVLGGGGAVGKMGGVNRRGGVVGGPMAVDAKEREPHNFYGFSVFVDGGFEVVGGKVAIGGGAWEGEGKGCRW
ncbi:hypothetical protein Acr_18g0008060 [Actinidia rufa]|uniref:Uncharacterized protein n=1 Tax=Actinidia rufa TaxID=165716 RepID=A0A7J0G773_9ERIC|nr:hypothetical protein Acr_18g0008060 [Actinidia rufa]